MHCTARSSSRSSRVRPSSIRSGWRASAACISASDPSSTPDAGIGVATLIATMEALLILATTLAALLVSTVALLTYEVRNYRDFLVTDATTQADILARTGGRLREALALAQASDG